MNRHFLVLVGVVITFLVPALASCGSISSSGGGTPTPGTSPGGSVSVSTNSLFYLSTDVVTAFVSNPLRISIFAYDTRTSCTILALQEQINSMWQNSQVGQCLLGRRAVLVEIPAGKVYTATITPRMSATSQATFPPGTYRLCLSYTTSSTPLPQQIIKNMITVYSAPFVVT